MGRTIAEELRAQGKKEEAVQSRRQVLLDQLRQRFGKLPRETVATVEATTNVKQLDTWLRRIVTIATLAEGGIGSAPCARTSRTRRAPSRSCPR